MNGAEGITNKRRKQTVHTYYYGGPELIGPNIVSRNSEIYSLFMYTTGPINYGPP